MLKSKIIAYERKYGRNISLRRAFNKRILLGGGKKKRTQMIDLRSYRAGLDDDAVDAYDQWVKGHVVMFDTKERVDRDSLLLVWIAVKALHRPTRATKDGDGDDWGRVVTMKTTETGTTENYEQQETIRVVKREESIDVNKLTLQGTDKLQKPLREKQKYDILKMAAGRRTAYMKRDKDKNIYYSGLHGNYFIYNAKRRLNSKHLSNIVGTLSDDTVCLNMLHDRLYLGSELSANVVKEKKDWAIVRLGGIKARKKLEYSAPNNFHDAYIQTSNDRQEFFKIMRDASDAIDKALKTNKKVLVHCEQGINRSVASIVFWGYTKTKFDAETIIQYVRARNKERNKNLGALTNSKFEDLLLQDSNK